jgi:predicted nuclease of predicted toxin-antitoxin system
VALGRIRSSLAEVKLLIDMNLSPAWTRFFAAHAIEATHWSDLGDPHAQFERCALVIVEPSRRRSRVLPLFRK